MPESNIGHRLTAWVATKLNRRSVATSVWIVLVVGAQCLPQVAEALQQNSSGAGAGVRPICGSVASMSQAGTLESFLQSNIQTEPTFPAPTVPEIFEELPGDRALLGTSSRQLEMRSGNAMLIVGLIGHLPVWALSRSPVSPGQIVCEFQALTEGAKSGVRALTDYERLMKATGGRPWDYLLDTRCSD